MPGYKGHLVGGLIAYLIMLYVSVRSNTTVPEMFGWFVCSLAGSLFPDVDITSKGQKLLFRGLFVVFIALVIFQKTYAALSLSLCGFMPLLSNHRGLFHRFWFIALVVIVPLMWVYVQMPGLYWHAVYAGLFFIAGAYSHLYLDVGFKRMWRV